MKDIKEYRRLIESALAHGGGTHVFEDVVEMVEQGKAQFWPGPHSVLITEVVEHPQKKVLHFFLAAGNLRELNAMYPGVESWGKEQGCTSCTLSGRKGWQRVPASNRAGWQVTQVLMEKEL